MDDLQIAKQILKHEKLNLVFVKNSKPLFKTSKEGLGGFLEAMEKFNDALSGASVADKIIGKAAALLCAYSNVKAAYAITLSKSGLNILNTHNISCEFEILVSTILNSKKTDLCPFEKLIEKINNPKKAYEKIRQFHARAFCNPSIDT